MPHCWTKNAHFSKNNRQIVSHAAFQRFQLRGLSRVKESTTRWTMSKDTGNQISILPFGAIIPTLIISELFPRISLFITQFTITLTFYNYIWYTFYIFYKDSDISFPNIVQFLKSFDFDLQKLKSNDSILAKTTLHKYVDRSI